MQINSSELNPLVKPNSLNRKLMNPVSAVWQRIKEYFYIAFNHYNYKSTLMSIFRLPPHLLYSSEAANLFQKLKMHGLIAEKNINGTPCSTLNFLISKALSRLNFIYVERFIQSGALITLENWMAIIDLDQTYLFKWIPLTSFFFNYEKRLLEIAERDSLVNQEKLLINILAHYSERRQQNPHESIYYKKSFLNLLAIYAKNNSIQLFEPKLQEWLETNLKKNEIYEFLWKFPFEIGMNLLISENSTNLHKSRFIVDAIKSSNLNFLKVAIQVQWHVRFNTDFIQNIWNLIEATQNEAVACLMLGAKVKPWNKNNLLLTKWISIALRQGWGDFLRKLYHLEDNEIPNLLRINHPEIFNQLLKTVIKNEFIFQNSIMQAFDLKSVEKIHLILDAFPGLSLPLTYMQELGQWAAENNHLLLLERLVAKGLNLEVELPNKFCFFDHATMHCKVSLLDILVKFNSDKFTQLQRDVWKNKFPHGVSRKVLQNSKTYRGQTLLHLAVMKNHTHLLEDLLKEGLDPNVMDKNMLSPLHLCRRFNYQQAAKLLITYGANPLVTNATRLTPINYHFGKSDLFFYSLFGGKKFLNQLDTINREAFIKYSAYHRRSNLLNKLTLDKQTIEAKQELVRRKELAHIWSCREKEPDFDGWYPNPCYKPIMRSALCFFKQLHKQNYLNLSADLMDLLMLGLKSMGSVFQKKSHFILSEIRLSKPVIILSGWKGHLTSFIIYKEKLVKVNRGSHAHLFKIELFQIQNTKALDADFLNRLIKHESQELFLYEVNKILDLKFEQGISLSSQKVPNCSAATTKTTVLALLFLLFQDFNIDHSLALSKKVYKRWITYLLKKSYHNYLRNSKNPDEELIKEIKQKSRLKGIKL